MPATSRERSVAHGSPSRPVGWTSDERTKSEERLFSRILAENAPEVVYRLRLGPDEAFEYASPSAFATTGYTPQEHYADAGLFRKMVHPDDRPRLEAVLAQPDLARGPVEMRWTRKDGRLIRVEWRGAVVTDDAGNAVALEGIVRDVTEDRHVEDERRQGIERARELERLRELDRLKTRIINTAAHELCTPLTPIKVQVHLLSTKYSTNLHDEQIKALAVIDRNVERLTQIVKDVLDVASLQAGALPVQKRPLDLSAVLVEAAASFEEEASRAGVLLEARVEPGLRVNGDVARLTQAVFNLLSNALKSTPRGGHASLDASAHDGVARIRVADDGRGLAVEEIPRLFQPFVRLDDAMEKGRPGTGVGLYVTRGIVEEHGGRIWCTSEGRGLGSTFSMTMPLLPDGERR